MTEVLTLELDKLIVLTEWRLKKGPLLLGWYEECAFHEKKNKIGQRAKVKSLK